MKKVRRETLPVIVAREIENDIRHGVLTRGERLPGEISLSERLGVSRPAVREALRILQGAGLIDIRFSEGAYVADRIPEIGTSTVFGEAELRELLAAELVQLDLEGVSVPSTLRRSLDEEMESCSQTELARLYDDVSSLIRESPNVDEPSALATIKDVAPAFRTYSGGPVIVDGSGRERIETAVMGRIIGCISGKPLEGWSREHIARYLDFCGYDDPERRQIPLVPFDESASKRATGGGVSLAPDAARCAPPLNGPIPRDDDLDYTILALSLLERYGAGFSTADVAVEWTERLPIGQVFTAERQAYRNIASGVPPEDAGSWRNPYRELIGAQIRVDVYGLVFAGDPLQAVHVAYQDAYLSHRKNGIYGAVYVAALYSLLGGGVPLRDALRQAMQFLPPKSRATRLLTTVFQRIESGCSPSELWNFLSENYRADDYQFVHVLPNLAIVAAILSFLDEGVISVHEGIAAAIRAGYDTDCNAATVGGIAGFVYGVDAVPEHWVQAIGGRTNPLDTAVYGEFGVTPAGIADRIVRLRVQLGIKSQPSVAKNIQT